MRCLRFVPLIVLVTLLSGCQIRVLNPASDTAQTQSNLIYLSFGLMMLVLIVVIILFTRFVYKYRETGERIGCIPGDKKENKLYEIIWTVLPVLLLVVLAVPTVKATYDLTYKSAAGEGFKQDAVNVQVEARQFAWTFTYENGKKSHTELVLPVDKKAALTISSVDVVHSFWVPRLGGKMDAIPGKKTHLAFVPNKQGTYQGKCAEFCGSGHATMRFKARVVSEDEYEKWLRTEGE
ncbi:cytochrome c oxidase subunit II [Halobacillus salinarum]|uniref:Cytochrome c oxidase subunit 2 n=1 Tax=Halobacillus salinarum TaxID=2932257 RepID=A0ABY4ELE3_9BACI|nr:cytochrome c oxidase subunit II [Halobacillus salinarum]UOQ45279.1 cytochrome c oxidase subunit II [Halobacillus salinarum]